MDIKEWMIEFLKHKDVFLKKIVEIEENDEGFLIKYKDKKQVVLVSRVFDDRLLQMIEDADGFDSIVVAVNNSTGNLDYMIESWSKLSPMPGLMIYFVNPNSSTEQKWIVSPYSHERIADPGSLKDGLYSMFATVEQNP
jgi:hypothetical protein